MNGTALMMALTDSEDELHFLVLMLMQQLDAQREEEEERQEQQERRFQRLVDAQLELMHELETEADEEDRADAFPSEEQL